MSVGAKRRLTFTGAGRTYVPKSATFRTEPSAQFTLVREMLNNLNKSIEFLILIVLVLYSCDNSEPYDEPKDNIGRPYPTIITNFNTIDVNNDNEADFIFETKNIGTDDEPMSNMSMLLEIRSNDNLLLYKIGDGNIPFAFGEIIQENMGSIYTWGSYGSDIVWKNWNIEIGWADDWNGTWVDVSNKYMPFAFINFDSTYYGWIEMSINTNIDTCFVEVHGYKYNTNSGQSIKAGE